MLGGSENKQQRKPPMKEPRNEPTEEQAHFLDSAAAFQGYIHALTRQALVQVFEQEIEALCGRRYGPDAHSDFYRAGSAPSYVMTEAGREPMQRPRVRRARPEAGSEEVALKSWKLAQSPDEWEAATMRAVLCGVSTRDMPTLRASELAGQSRSSVSRLWQQKSAELVDQMQQADLSGFEPVVLMLDAVVLAKGLVATVALGINAGGVKQVLGFRVGSSENAQVCRDLLSSLHRRGLKAPAGRYLLAILDGSEALKQALLEVYPHTLIQRCLVHKERNLRGYLSKRDWSELARLFKRLRRSQGAEQAKEAAEAIEAFLSDKNAQARNSWAECGEELLTLLRLDISNELNKSLLSTNCIENVFKNLRRHIGKVCRWRESTDQADRWLASGLILASKGFRRIAGHHCLPELIRALGSKFENDQRRGANNKGIAA
jgi:putative transposase